MIAVILVVFSSQCLLKFLAFSLQTLPSTWNPTEFWRKIKNNVNKTQLVGFSREMFHLKVGKLKKNNNHRFCWDATRPLYTIIFGDWFNSSIAVSQIAVIRWGRKTYWWPISARTFVPYCVSTIANLVILYTPIGSDLKLTNCLGMQEDFNSSITDGVVDADDDMIFSFKFYDNKVKDKIWGARFDLNKNQTGTE